MGTRTRRKRAQGRPLINAQTDDGKIIRAITLFDQNENAITLRMSKTRFVLIFYTYFMRVVRLISRGLCTCIIYADVACLVVSFPYKYSDGRRRTSIYYSISRQICYVLIVSLSYANVVLHFRMSRFQCDSFVIDSAIEIFTYSRLALFLICCFFYFVQTDNDEFHNRNPR